MTSDEHRVDCIHSGETNSTSTTPTPPIPQKEMMMTTWTTRTEAAGDQAAIRTVNATAFETEAEAELVDELRQDLGAWISDLSIVTTTPEDEIVGFALFSRCTVGGEPALALGPCAVVPDYQRTGAGGAAITAGLTLAKALGENLVVVLGHPEYYPRFGFTPASGFGVIPPQEWPDDAFMALSLNPEVPTPRGEIVYPPAFGID